MDCISTPWYEPLVSDRALVLGLFFGALLLLLSLERYTLRRLGLFVTLGVLLTFVAKPYMPELTDVVHTYLGSDDTDETVGSTMTLPSSVRKDMPTDIKEKSW